MYVENIVTYYIPNAFTPNGDGKNDNFKVTGYSVSGYNMEIYNRWGQQIFKSSGAFDEWKGDDAGGKSLPSGVYSYQIRIYNDPSHKVRNGVVTLVR
ncbi:MAG: gliding motility-associated C-terminal domain-containing protein [Bacteroidota bacterium]|nr:gliding motility-associated C-terminal domain-containing protein [Bacteroidota bacterium]